MLHVSSAVYYNPAKTMGGMIEADLFCLLGLLYASFVCLGSMGMYWWIEDKHGLDWLADIIVLSWVGISMATIAFMKVWLVRGDTVLTSNNADLGQANPSFNTGKPMLQSCSLPSLTRNDRSMQYDGHHNLRCVSIHCGSCPVCLHQVQDRQRRRYHHPPSSYSHSLYRFCNCQPRLLLHLAPKRHRQSPSQHGQNPRLLLHPPLKVDERVPPRQR